MPIQVFLSHSAGDNPADLAFVEDLRDRLRGVQAPPPDGGAQFEVFFDQDTVRAGEHWRKKIFDRLGVCHAGVVVLNERALNRDQFPWVHTEASILRWRMWMGEDLALLLMFRGAGTRDEYAKRKEWGPLAFDEIQFLQGRQEFTGPALDDAAFDALVTQLRKTGVAPTDTRYARLRKALSDRLSKIPLDAAGARRWTEKLLTEGPVGMAALIEECVDPDKESVQHALDLIAPWWVDPRSSCRLAAAALPTQGTALFALNGSDIQYTPIMYVRHACCLGAQYAWKVLPVGANAGLQDAEQFRASVVSEARKQLVDAFRQAWRDPQKVTDADINARLDSLLAMKPPRPTFVALPPHVAADEKVAEAILAAFPPVKLILMTNSPEQAAAIPHAVPLEPLPDAAVESGELNRYLDIMSILS
jgi:hypothetical protein